MITTMHLAAQYLATAAISFIPKKEDDSHTNLGWKNHALETHQFPNGGKLSLNYENFSLEWINHNGNKEHLLLNGTTHLEIVKWISQTSKNTSINKTYNYNLHYELPYDTVTNSSTFKLTNHDAVNILINQRNLAQIVISSVLKSNGFDSSIRIWPHHFDTGAFVNVNDKLSLGIGMAIPDSLIDDFYFYISGYAGHDAIILEFIDQLKHGDYYNNGWQGFAIPLKELEQQTAIDFFQVAINMYLNSV